jgi:cytochrome c oxidase subunit 1
MFASGLGPVSVTVFSLATMAIAVPTGVKIVNWVMTMWGGKLTFTVPMLFAVALVVQFTIGGLSGVTHAVAPSDTQQTDTYYIVAHFHYVLFGGAIFGLFAGFYYWWPKMFRKQLSENLGRWNFWLMVVGMNMTFGPMHILGLQGQPRRMQVWTEARAGEGFFNLGFWNMIASIGSFTLAIGVLFFIINIIYTHKSKKVALAPLDPWDASTHQIKQVATADEVLADLNSKADEHIHMPSRSYWPILLALGLPIMAYGLIYNMMFVAVGAAVVLFTMFGWAMEPSTSPDDDFDPPASEDGHTKELAPLG